MELPQSRKKGEVVLLCLFMYILKGLGEKRKKEGMKIGERERERSRGLVCGGSHTTAAAVAVTAAAAAVGAAAAAVGAADEREEKQEDVCRV